VKAIYPTDNEFGIPRLELRPEPAAPGLTAPVCVWGAVGRKKDMGGTWLFYTDDYRFETAWSDPGTVPATSCVGATEPNFSVFDETSRAEALWQIYRKRWLARSWQDAGILVWVDLFVAHTHLDVALLGVPVGWQRYATSGVGSRAGELDLELGLARSRSGGAQFTLLVYGGGREVAEWATGRPEVIHVPHRRDASPRLGEGTRRRLAREAQSAR
jgi:hypothetical protein